MNWEVKVEARPRTSDGVVPAEAVTRMQELFQEPGELVSQPLRNANITCDVRLELRFEI